MTLGNDITSLGVVFHLSSSRFFPPITQIFVYIEGLPSYTVHSQHRDPAPLSLGPVRSNPHQLLSASFPFENERQIARAESTPRGCGDLDLDPGRRYIQPRSSNPPRPSHKGSKITSMPRRTGEPFLRESDTHSLEMP